MQPLTIPLSHPTPPLPSPLSLPSAVFASAAAGPGAVTLRRFWPSGPAAGSHPTGTDPAVRVGCRYEDSCFHQLHAAANWSGRNRIDYAAG